jgi:chromate transporter
LSASGEVRRGRRNRWPALEVLLVAGRLGLTSFGGPVAHLGYFRDEYVVRRRWLDERTYADLVALCQLLPGPASSQLGIAIGILRARLAGGIAAWLGFTLPSAIALTGFALAVRALGTAGDLNWLHGLQVVAVAVVAQAVWSMGRSLAPDRPRMALALAAAAVALLAPVPWGQIAVVVGGGVVGAAFLRSVGQPAPPAEGEDAGSVQVPVSRRVGVAVLALFAVLLVALPVAGHLLPGRPLAVFESFFEVGSFVFGGGHVVLPLLQAQVVPPGWVTNQQFLAGYGAAQAVPGPLFTFSAYLGAVMSGPVSGVPGAALTLVAIFLPSFLLVIGALPFWGVLRHRRQFQAVLRGVNAAVVGLLLAALYNPVWVSTIRGVPDFVLLLVASGLLFVARTPPWVVVVVTGLLGAGLYAVTRTV